LMERCITLRVFSARGDLFGVNDIHRVTEAVVGETDSTAKIP
jgi:hypothetical protein